MAAILAGNGEDKKPLEVVTDAKEMGDLHRLSQNQGLYDESDRKRPWDSGMKNSSSFNSEESALDCDPSHFEGNRACEALIESTSMQAAASGGQPSESNAAYFHWPPPHGEDEYAEDRHKFFEGLQKGTNTSVESCQQATILLDLMMIRAYNSKQLRRFSLATAIGFRTRKGILTDIPAIIVFVAHKVHHEWLRDVERLPSKIMGPGGIWCDVDVVEFSYYTTPTIIPKQPVYSELAERLQGNDPTIGPGSQVANQETFGTLGAIVQSRTGNHQVGFLTNRHVAVNLDYPNQKMFHPLPPNLGPGVYLGAVERATSFITDDVWYNIFTSLNPETFVRADGAFIPFRDNFDMKCVMTEVKGLGEMGDVMMIDLQKPIGTVVGQEVVKVGRSSGLTTGRIMAYALEYNDERGICFFTDFLIVGKDKQTFDLEGDSGSLILMSGDKPRPVGIIWGGTANRGRLKLHSGHEPENWTTGVDLGRLLELLQLDLITNNEMLQEAMRGQRCSIFESCSELTQLTEPPQKPDITYEDRQCQCSGVSKNHHLIEEQEEGGVEPVITLHRPDLKLINFVFSSPPPVDIQDENQTSPTYNNTTESLSFGLDSFEREAKRRKS